MERKKYWLLPIIIVLALLKQEVFTLSIVIIVLALFGALIVLSQGTVVAPFIYTIF